MNYNKLFFGIFLTLSAIAVLYYELKYNKDYSAFYKYRIYCSLIILLLIGLNLIYKKIF